MSRHTDRRSSRGNKDTELPFGKWLQEDKLVRRPEMAMAVNRLISWRLLQQTYNRWYWRAWRWFVSLFKRAGNGENTEGDS